MNNKSLNEFEIHLRSAASDLSVGALHPVRVNCNVGINNEEGRQYEVTRLETIRDNDCLPDTFMDLSIGHFDSPFYQEIQRRFKIPIGFVPSYLLPSRNSVTNTEAIDIIKKLADDGIAFITLHLTASLELYEKAKQTRQIAMTSRGGGAVLQQMKMTGKENIWKACLPEIVRICKANGIAISLGSTFRPAGVSDACDEVHIKETQEQMILCQMLQAEGIQVMVENVGHIAINKLEDHCQMLRQFNAPIMPLGPTPTDCAIGNDHIAAAVGAVFMGYWGCAHIINCVTRAEHQNSFFTIEETLEAIRSAKLAAHIIDISRGIGCDEDQNVYEQRADQHNCLAMEGKNCLRCAELCPVKMY